MPHTMAMSCLALGNLGNCAWPNTYKIKKQHAWHLMALVCPTIHADSFRWGPGCQTVLARFGAPNASGVGGIVYGGCQAGPEVY